MTIQALKEQHRMIIGLNQGSSEDATKLSIQYAIEVLEELYADYKTGTRGWDRNKTVSKIEELKQLLK